MQPHKPISYAGGTARPSPHRRLYLSQGTTPQQGAELATGSVIRTLSALKKSSFKFHFFTGIILSWNLIALQTISFKPRVTSLNTLLRTDILLRACTSLDGGSVHFLMVLESKSLHEESGDSWGWGEPKPQQEEVCRTPSIPGELPQPAQNVYTLSSASQSFQSRWWVSFGLPKAGADGGMGPCVTMKHALDESGAQPSSAVVEEP